MGNVERFGHLHQIRQGSRMHFSHEVAAMDLHGNLAEAQFGRYLLVHEPGRHQPHHLPLARAQRLMEAFQSRFRLLLLAPEPVAVDRCSDRVQHVLITKRLGQEIDGPRLHGLYRHGYVAMSGHEDDWNMNIYLGELALEIQAALSRQPDIKYEAARNVRQLALEQFARRAEDLCPHPYRAEKPFERLAEFRIVLDDEDGRPVTAASLLPLWLPRDHSRASRCACKANSKVAPGPALLDARNTPPWFSMIERQIDSPMPIPSGLVVKKALKSCGIFSVSMPTPESSTATTTWS